MVGDYLANIVYYYQCNSMVVYIEKERVVRLEIDCRRFKKVNKNE